MDMDAPMVNMAGAPAVGVATTLCYNCGSPIDSQGAVNICMDCIKLTTDISSGIQRDGVLHTCRDCERWLAPPASWITANLESKELLAICLKKLRGLNKVRLTDASFIWTEPHSRRIRVKLTIMGEMSDGILLSQSFEVVYIVRDQQCPDCAKSFTHHAWRASVQVRQHVDHKRLFLYLEQLILKNGAHRNTINIKEMHEGLDFYFAQLNDANSFVDFIKGACPIQIKSSKQIISEDSHTAKKSYKFSISVTIAPVNRDDLIPLPLSIAKKFGNIAPLALCHRLGTNICLMDPNTLQTADIPGEVYWREPFKPLAETRDLVEFIILDIEPTNVRRGKWVLANCEVARASDLGFNNRTYFIRTHLGGILKVGDSAMGYMLTGSNFNNEEFEKIQDSRYGSQIPDVVLVKKHHPNRRRKRRHWKLRRMDRDDGDLLPKKADQERRDAEYEDFLRSIEEDDELRAALALYKNTKKSRPDPDAMSVAETEVTGEDDGPAIDMDELLDDFEELDLAEQQA